MVWIRASIRVAGAAVLALHVSVSSFHLKFFRAGSRETSDSGADTDPDVDPGADPDADDAPDFSDPGACPIDPGAGAAPDPGAGGVFDSVGNDDASDSHAVLAVEAVAVCVGSDTDRQVYNIFQIWCFVWETYYIGRDALFEESD
tara:strand:+ start:1216 stop:1650 length:435 start_codon:yes stop_codon:yes gene_type:complete